MCILLMMELQLLAEVVEFSQDSVALPVITFFNWRSR